MSSSAIWSNILKLEWYGKVLEGSILCVEPPVEGTKGGKVLQTIYWRKEDLMLSHINSTARPGLQGTTPLELALQHFGADTVEKLGLQIIKADDVCLKPQLLK